jgi:hypothetical protein
MKKSLHLPVTLTLFSALCSAQSVTEGFEGGRNEGGWTWGAACENINSSGGNPDAFLTQQCLDTFACQPRTTDSSSLFCGDWRATRATSFSVDLITHSTQFNFQRELYLILKSGPLAITLGHGDPNGVPQVADGWRSLSFVVDSSSPVMPAHWYVLTGAGNPDSIWNAVIQDVTEVRLFYGDPQSFFIFDQWHTGMDNPRITTAVGSNYCQSGANGASISASGSNSISANDLTLLCDAVPNNTFGLFFYGDGMASTPLGNGLRCVSVNSMTTRLGPPQSSGSDGVFMRELGLPSPTSGGSIIQPGSSWYFQAWFRDGSSSDLSDGLQIDFQL